MEIVLGIGIVIALTSALLISLLGQPRIWYAMAKDGLFPMSLSKIHPKFGTPHITTIISGVVAGIMGAVVPIDVLAELTSIGTLVIFAAVCAGVMILRLKRPDLTREFKVPFGPYIIPILGTLANLLLIASATVVNLAQYVIWTLIGLIFYFFYGRTHSRMVRHVKWVGGGESYAL